MTHLVRRPSQVPVCSSAFPGGPAQAVQEDRYAVDCPRCLAVLASGDAAYDKAREAREPAPWIDRAHGEADARRLLAS
jgi:hypothetical protein